MTATTLTQRPPHAVARPPREKVSSWPLIDRIFYRACWATGIGLAFVAAWIVVFMLVKGIAYVRPSLLTTSPSVNLQQSASGGIKDPLIGTLIVTVIGTAIAAPLGVGIASWLVEYRRPAWLARSVESAIEMLAGVPSIVLALFGLVVFSQGFLTFLSQGAQHGSLGESFLIAGIVMSLLALPLVLASTRESLQQLPPRMREASFALGKTRITTLRHVLLPAIRPGIASGVVLGMGRIIGDTAIITVLLGASVTNEPAGHTPLIGTLRGTGSTLTSYVYFNSPSGEGNSPEKAYAAAFVLLVMVLLLNAFVTRLSRGGERDTKRSRFRAISFLGRA
jgi:phosphate transport system permease protein